MKMLKETSRTFFIPISMLSKTLKKTVGSAYLCMRASDESEDHEELDLETKASLLRQTSDLLRKDSFDNEQYLQLIEPYEHQLPEVSVRLADWLDVCPTDI